LTDNKNQQFSDRKNKVPKKGREQMDKADESGDEGFSTEIFPFF